MKRWIVLSLLLVPLLAAAAGFWDGNAALQRGDASFESGLFATSNSFPPGTQITIQNQDTGKTVTATITGRIEGQSDILVLLSPKTAEALDLPQGTLGRVRVTVPPRADSSGSAQPGDQTASSDPDVNPAAAYGAPDRTEIASAPTDANATPAGESPAAASSVTEPPATESPSMEAPAEAPAVEAPATETPAEATPAATPESPAQEQPVTAPQTTAASATPETPAGPDADSAAILSAAQSRTPQKQVFQPPREDEKFVYQKPATVPPQAVAATTPAATPQGEPTITSVAGEPGVSPAAQPASDMALADVVAPEESRPEEIVGAGSAVPGPAASQAQVALASPEPAPEGQPTVTKEPVQTEVTGPAAVPHAGQGAPKLALVPPEAPAPAPTSAQPVQQTTVAAAATTPRSTATATTAKPPASAPVQTAASLPRTGTTGNYFLQLAAYGTEQVARDLAAKLAPTYPALVLSPSNPGSSVFKVVIGPLNRAESGTLLTWFRYRGFPDAFLKQE
jgi:hypothetical protein